MFTPNINASSGLGASLNSIKQSVNKLNQSATEIANPESSSDLIDNITSQIVSKHEFSANISVIKSKDETLGTLLDLIS